MQGFGIERKRQDEQLRVQPDSRDDRERQFETQR